LSGLWSMVVRRWRHSTSLSLTSSSIARPFHAHGLSPNPRTACRYRYRSICLLFVRCSCAQSPCSSRATPSTSTVAELFPLRRTRLEPLRSAATHRPLLFIWHPLDRNTLKGISHPRGIPRPLAALTNLLPTSFLRNITSKVLLQTRRS
jgi:hypothetical protein